MIDLCCLRKNEAAYFVQALITPERLGQVRQSLAGHPSFAQAHSHADNRLQTEL